MENISLGESDSQTQFLVLRVKLLICVPTTNVLVEK